MNLSYASVCCVLATMHIDLNWADEQYMTTLLKIVREYNKLGKKSEKRKVTASEMSGFIRG